MEVKVFRAHTDDMNNVANGHLNCSIIDGKSYLCKNFLNHPLCPTDFARPSTTVISTYKTY